jgi:c-di-GMP-binding flagellar brake protein YcgR
MPIPLELNQGVRVLVPFGAVSYPWDAQVVAVDLPRFEIVIPDLDLSEVALSGRSIQVVVANPDGLHTVNCPVVGDEDDRFALLLPEETPVQTIQRRHHARIEVSADCPAKVQVLTEWGFDSPIHGHLKDLSAGGCAVYLLPALGPDTEIRVVFRLPDESEVGLEGSVTHCAAASSPDRIKHLIGIRFHSVPDAARELLDRFIARSASDQLA